ncbi:MAG: DNA polymerase III subunit epsilon [Parasphingorhabdus sp.]|nr:DNA polymerase III subunit epsilon [Parasphingorhabdus sp.]
MREIIFDTETTGFDPQDGDRMVEIGCIEMIDRIETGETFHAYFNPQRAMPQAAEAVHGLSDKFLSDKPLFADHVDHLLAFLGDAKLVAHNARFDFGFLNMELARCERAQVDDARMIDTLAMARSRHPGAKLSLDALCTRYGIDRSHRVKHGALLDAELLSQLYIELTGGRQIGLGLADIVIGDQKIHMHAADRTAAVTLPVRHFAASAAELERHAAFVATIEGALWGSRDGN